MSRWLALFVLCAAIRGIFEVGGERNGSGGALGAGGAVSRARAGAWARSRSRVKRINSVLVCPSIFGLRGGGGGEGGDEHLEQGGSQVGCEGDVAPPSSMDSIDARIISFTDAFSRDLWPLTPDRLSRSGFYHCPTPGKPDRAVCHSCRLALYGWSRLDHPIMQHLRWGHHECAFLRRSAGDVMDLLASHPLTSAAMLKPPAPHGKCLSVHVPRDGGQQLREALTSRQYMRPLRVSISRGDHQIDKEVRVMGPCGVYLYDSMLGGDDDQAQNASSTSHGGGEHDGKEQLQEQGEGGGRGRDRLTSQDGQDLPQLQHLHNQQQHRGQVRPKQQTGAKTTAEGWGQGNEGFGRIWGHWWLMPGSLGTMSDLALSYAAHGPQGDPGYKGAQRGKSCLSVWGSPWVLSSCSVSSAGGVALLCARNGSVISSSCTFGGITMMPAGLCSSALYTTHTARVLCVESVICACELYGLRASHRSEVALCATLLRGCERAVGIDDDSQVWLTACELQDNEACFHAVQNAAGARLTLSSVVMLHAGEVWFDSRRPGVVEEKGHPGTSSNITLSSGAAAGSSNVGPNKRPRQQYHPGVDSMHQEPVAKSACF